MNNIEKRLDRLEGYYPKQRTVEEMTSDELAELVTGIPGTKFDDLTVEYLEAVVRGEKPTLP
ncbi:hypothetical protein ACFLVX_05685 [Chloroflexota bacterium]